LLGPHANTAVPGLWRQKGVKGSQRGVGLLSEK
jgi:hypothetical protein